MKPEDYVQVRMVLVKKEYREDGGAATFAYEPVADRFIHEPGFMIDFIVSKSDPEPLTREDFEIRVAAQRKAGTYLE